MKVVALGVFVSLLLPFTAASVMAQPRTVKIINPFPAGGSVDILARVLSDQIAKTTGQRFVMENRPGAGTVIANEAVARAVPDGSTLLMVANSFVISRQLRNANYDPLTSFAPICLLVTSPQVIVVNSTSSYFALSDLIAGAKARPGELTIASNGPATLQHIAAEMFKKSAGLNLTYIPFNGSGPAVNALLGSHVTSVLTNYIDASPQLSGGTFRALATTSTTRIPPMPDLPTVTELGFAFDASAWFGIVAPARTPPEIISDFSRSFGAALDVFDVRSSLIAQGVYPSGTCGVAFGEYLRRETVAAAKAVREAGIKAE